MLHLRREVSLVALLVSGLLPWLDAEGAYISGRGDDCLLDAADALSYGEAFANAVLTHDQDLVTSYLSEELENQLIGDLEVLYQSQDAEVRAVVLLGEEEFQPLTADEFVTITSFWTGDETVLVRAVWAQTPHQLVIRTMQILEGLPKEGNGLSPLPGETDGAASRRASPASTQA
jgi:hypothetical protein